MTVSYSPIVLMAAGFLAAGVCTAILIWRLRKLRRQMAAAERVLRRNQAIVDGSGEGVLELDDSGKVVFANPTALRLLGYEAEELVQIDYRLLLGASDYLGPRDASRMGYTTDMLRGIGAVLRCKDGRARPVEYRMLALRRSDDTSFRAKTTDKVGRHQHLASSLLVFRDLTDRSRVDVMLADMQHLAKVGAWELNVGSSRFSVSEGISRRLQLSAGRSVHAKSLLLGFTLEARRALFNAMRAAVTHGHSFDLELQVRDTANPRQGGEWLRVMGKAERVDGITVRLYGAVQDITDRKQAEYQVRQMGEFFGATIDALPSAVMFFNQREQIEYCNRSALSQWLGIQTSGSERSLQEALGEHAAHLVSGIRQALKGEPAQWLRPFVHGEQLRQIQCNFVPRVGQWGGRGGCWIVLSDVTELKMLEARLYQAEKMQAVGQLTGGVAHDFNNLLGVILGNLQLLERDLPRDEAAQRKLTTAVRAALRGSELTRRLLSFARRQTLDSQVMDASEQLKSLTDLLQQTLGDTVQIRFELEAQCWPVKVDVGQFENAVLNLVLNARDAMPTGGTLIVKTCNMRPTPIFFREHTDIASGDYVEVSIADTGKGIPAQLMNRIFEPFFTTKEVGKGSGLGLAMVHGFIKQSLGAIAVRSEPGQGTTISMYLPRSHSRPLVADDQQYGGGIQGGAETILVVEDDTDLRATTVLALQEQGYRVLEASSAEAALAILAQSVEIDILFTDIILPGGMLGTELAQRARAIKPAIQVLLTTGYQGDALQAPVGAKHHETCLPKPYRNEELAIEIRSLLDGERAHTDF